MMGKKEGNPFVVPLFFIYLCIGVSIYKNNIMGDKEQNRRDMKVNVNHPSFISFLENISQNILSAIKIDLDSALTYSTELRGLRK